MKTLRIVETIRYSIPVSNRETVDAATDAFLNLESDQRDSFVVECTERDVDIWPEDPGDGPTLRNPPPSLRSQMEEAHAALVMFLDEYANGLKGADSERNKRPEVIAARAAIAKAKGTT